MESNGYQSIDMVKTWTKGLRIQEPKDPMTQVLNYSYLRTQEPYLSANDPRKFLRILGPTGPKEIT